MSDHEWQAPGAPTHGPRPDAPPPLPPAPPGPVGPGAYGPPTPPPLPPTTPVAGHGAVPASYPPPTPQGAWTPPPRPGLLPLRPLGFGTLLWAPFRTLRRNPAATFGSGLVVQLVSGVATAAVFVPFLAVTMSRLENAAEADADAIMAGTVGGFLLLMLVPIAISVVASAFLQGVMVVEVASGTLGDSLGFGALWRRAARRIWPLIGWTLLVGAALLVGFALLVAIVVLTGMISPVGLAVGIAVAAILALGLAVLGAWIGVKVSLVPSVIVLEHAGIRTAMARSWRLTDGFYWRTFGTLILVGVILNTAANIVVQPVSLVGTLLAVIVDPTGTGAALTITIVTTVVTFVLSLLIGAITAVVQAALVAVIYIDLRMRKEGLDLELERHVEARGAGLPVEDPYRPPAGAAPYAGATAMPATGSERPATWS